LVRSVLIEANSKRAAAAARPQPGPSYELAVSNVYSSDMDTWDTEPNVRPVPVPVEDEEGVRFSDTFESSQERTVRRRRPWLPLAVSGVVVAGLVGAVTLFGAVEFQDAPATDPDDYSLTADADSDAAPADALPPTLEQAVPGISERLTLITTDEGTIWTLVWDPSFRVPKTSAPITREGTVWAFASFDTGGRLVAAGGAESADDQSKDVWIGRPPSFDYTPHIQDVLSLTWHATEVARLAFVRHLDGSFALETVAVDPLTTAPQEPETVATFPEPPTIVRWDTDGFILQMGDETVALDSQGDTTWSFDGLARTASPGFVPLIRQTEGGDTWHLVDRTTGEPESFTEFGVSDSAAEIEWVAATSNDVFAGVAHREEGTTLTVVGPNQNANRVVQLNGTLSPIQFTSDSALLIFGTPRSNDLTFVNWRTGATHLFDIPGSHLPLAINIG
jgi:hypothetical protein